ncbi:hypothetical protein DENSPDRAFT_855418 [Dentipellis sp. KUC8613]|nr:hypothetical protein DENSPDRAFT_855418 [Dentipellis sp. KUC8613]
MTEDGTIVGRVMEARYAARDPTLYLYIRAEYAFLTINNEKDEEDDNRRKLRVPPQFEGCSRRDVVSEMNDRSCVKPTWQIWNIKKGVQNKFWGPFASEKYVTYVLHLKEHLSEV